MKLFCLSMTICLLSCTGNVKESESGNAADAVANDTKAVERGDTTDADRSKTYSNARFRDVTVRKVAENRYVVEGEGQIFEANFGWVVEDGHNELKKGFEMTDAGAPEWGKFEFTIEVQKVEPNSTLTLVLFESSAKDGSRQYELPISLGTTEK